MQPFVGRTKELARVDALLDEVAAGRGGLVFFTGEPGIGKSRLSQHADALAREHGLSVAWGRCWEVGAAPAFWPWTQVFQALDIPDPFASSRAAPEGDERFALLDRAARLLTEGATKQPLALILDDLHAADQPSLDLLLALARRLRTARILVVGSYRDAEARLGSSGALLAKIAREGEVFPLARLRVEEVTAWIQSASPEADSEIGVEVHRVTEGNPLFVHALLRLGKVQSLDARRLPDGLNAVLDEHVALVPPETRDLLAIASVLGREVVISDVAFIAGATEDVVEAAFRRACAAGLLEPVVGHGDRYAMTHVLLRDRLYAELPTSRRAALHWKAGERLAARDEIAGAAFHLLEGVQAGDPRRAAEVAKEAAANAMARFAFEEAARFASDGLAALGRREESSLVCELEISRAEASVRAGVAGAKEDCARAAVLARKVSSAPLEARAALAYGAELMTSEIDETMVALLRGALASLERDETSGALRARVLARLAAALTPPTKETFEEVQRHAREAVLLARRVGDADTLVYATRFAMIALGYHVEREEYYDIVKEVTALATKHDRPLVLLDAAGWSMCTLREQGHRAEAVHSLDAYEALLTEFPRPNQRWRLPLFRATGALLDGELDAAEWLGRESLAIAEQAQQSDSAPARLGWAQHRVALAIARGVPAAIAPDADRILGILERYPRVWAISAWVLAAIGRADEARARLSEHALDETEYPMTLAAAEAVTLLRDETLAQRYYNALASLPGRLVMFWGGPAGTTAIGPWQRELANMASLLGRYEEARKLYDEAIQTAERLEAKPFITLARRGKEETARPAPRSTASTAPPSTAALVHAGEHWTVSYDGRVHVLRARRGLDYLAQLLREPGRELHVLDLSTIDSGENVRTTKSDRGAPILDATAKAAYRARLEALREKVETARAMGDGDRADEAQTEIDAIAAELAKALGLGGRNRTTTTAADRARAAVTLAIRRAIEAVKEVEPMLGGHLETAIRTGAFCAYRPDPRAALSWNVTQKS